MTEHNLRTGPDEGGYVEIVTGDGDSPQTAVDIPAEALVRADSIEYQYEASATVDTVLTVYDEADGTTAADASDTRGVQADVAPEESGEIAVGSRAFEEGVLVAADGTQDGPIHISVDGERYTDLADMVGR